MSEAPLVCGEPVVRTILLEEGCRKECQRKYMFYLPKAACGPNNSVGSSTTEAVGRLPLVFTIHCLGCSMQTFQFWSEVAEAYNFVWVNPEGLKHSFNAGGESCCGYALEQGIDDLGFLKGILSQVTGEYPSLLSSNYVYATGWSNGGYMVSYAAPLFRAIAPISGYHLDSVKLEERMITHEKPVSLFLHHSQDDPMVQMTGCCTDSTMPRCCCGISQHLDQCTSVEAHVSVWATNFNHCGSKTKVSYSVQDQVTCYTFEECGQNVNTTYCIYQNKKHFNRPSFEQAFPMTQGTADFFARDACSAPGGVWNGAQRTCACPSGASGTYCSERLLQEGKKERENSISPAPILMFLGLALVLVGSYYLVTTLFRRFRKGSLKRYSKVSTSDVELQQLEG
ncbi:polyhydroxybutyrate depolymerase [Seminavis robusta]|uniref:Polyhydroxybutyrate depolymerase n=1 Tax=Seminavis robusta TaxID=568900 RepID=A0A9N8D7X1_9STRA|nr:polyhydroxybutyrate depolymerase [Seminavis robusta]|eukprot:Sro30_g019900.1 polyhydroxybutyrate depolymerase (396) ;mRNA; f:149338-150525